MLDPVSGPSPVPKEPLPKVASQIGVERSSTLQAETSSGQTLNDLILPQAASLNLPLTEQVGRERSSSPQQHKENDPLARIYQVSTEMWKELAQYKGRNIAIDVMPGVTAGIRDQLKTRDQLETRVKLAANQSFFVLWSDSPVADINSHAVWKELPQAMTQENRLVVVPFMLESKHLGGTTGIVQVYDMLHPSRPLVLERKVNLESLPEQMKNIEQQLLAEYSARENDYQIALSSIPAHRVKPEQVPWSVVADKQLSPETQAQLHDLFSRYDVWIHATPEGKEQDRIIASYFILTEEMLQRTNYAPLAIQGLIGRVSLSAKEPEKGISLQQVSQEVGPSSLSYDKFQNAIDKYFRTSLFRNEVFSHCDVFPHIAFADTRQRQPIDLDLSAIGLGEIKELFYQQPVPPLMKQPPYTVYSDLSRNQLPDALPNTMQQIADGLQRAEQLFGFKPGDYVKNIWVANGHYRGASASLTNPGTIQVRDEELKIPENHAFAGFHEGVHVIDETLSWRVSSGSFETNYNNIKSNRGWFLTLINESRTLPNMEGIGHAQDNRKEFLASFLNSFNRENWEQWISRASLPYRRAYNDTLQALGDQLRTISEIRADAPIYKEIEQKRAFISKSFPFY